TMSDQIDPVALREELAVAVNNAQADGAPVAVAYVDGDDVPHLSLRGTVHVFSDQELAFWARSPGLPTALDRHPAVALLYQNLPARTFYQFNGTARVETHPELRDAIFEASPAAEQAHDPDRLGAAIVVAIETVDGRGPNGRVCMRRPTTRTNERVDA